jgi:hypothetical protein
VRLFPVQAGRRLAALVLRAASALLPQVAAEVPGVALAAEPARHADFGAERPTADARQVADWVLRSGDSQARPFIVIDKKAARVFIFSPEGALLGAAPALLGSAPGDHTVPGIGDRKLASIQPHERTTPAGRFLAELDLDIHGEEVLWVDYDSAVSLHRLPNSPARERRPQRLASASPLDNRITYGCINVSGSFFEQVVSPAFRGRRGFVYVLPERAGLHEVFGLEMGR